MFLKSKGKKLFICCLLFSILTGCVGMESSYKPHDLSGGYGEEKITDNTYIVFFDANGFTPPELTQKYFARRARQLTLKNDFDCFVVVEQKKTLNINYVTSNKLALKTKYYASNELRGGEDSNKLDDNSLSGIIQMHKQMPNTPQTCRNAMIVEE